MRLDRRFPSFGSEHCIRWLGIATFAAAAMAWSCTGLKTSSDEAPALGDESTDSDQADSSAGCEDIASSGCEVDGNVEAPDDGSTYDERQGDAPDAAGTSGRIVQYRAPLDYQGVQGIVAGPDGALYISDNTRGTIIRLTSAGLSTEYRVPGPFENGAGIGKPYSPAVGADGNLWFGVIVGLGNTQIARMTLEGVISSFVLPRQVFPGNFTAGADGNIWFVDTAYGQRVGRITPSGEVKEFEFQIGTDMFECITSGPDQNLWVTEVPNKIKRITTSGVATDFVLPADFSDPWSITNGPDGNVWFTEASAPPRIGRITPDGMISEFSARLGPSPPTLPTNIVTGADGNLWFTEADRIARMTPEGKVINEYFCQAGCYPVFLAAGSDGIVWYFDMAGQAVGLIYP